MDADRSGAPPRRAPKSASPELHVPPNNPEAERSLLACILWDAGSVLESCREHNLTSRAFYHGHHRQLFERVSEMHAAGLHVDAVTLAAELRSRGELEKFGGIQMLSDIAGAYQSAAGAPMFIASLLDFEERRNGIRDASQALEAYRNPNIPPEETNAQLLERITRSGTSTSRLPKIQDATELLAKDLKTPEELVKGLFRRGEKAVFGGASKSNKSWGAIDCAISVSHGVPFLGLPTNRGRVLIVNLELPQWALRKRIADIARAKRVTMEPGRLLEWSLRGFPVTAESLRAEIRAQRIEDLALVVVDPFYKLAAGMDENSAGQMTRVMMVLEGITEDTGAALLIPCHFAKGSAAQKESIDRISGSGVFARDPDSILTLTRHEEDSAFVLDATLRTLPPLEPIGLRWDFPVFVPDTGLDTTKLRQPAKPGPKSSYTVEQAVECLPSDGLTFTRWFEVAKSRFKVGKTKFTELSSAAVESGSVKKTGPFYVPAITKKGHE